ncbi:hypothetical protein TNCV_4032261 [Trichonephila clavipes]|nr:hypothetical protein TNCV_4032261 [Trichonephila clavipes]
MQNKCYNGSLQTAITGTMQRGASRRFNRVPSSSKGRRRAGTVQTEGYIIQRRKHEWGKPETRRLKGKKRNGERPSMQWRKAIHAMATRQACNGHKRNMKWQQAKYAMDTNQI